MRALQRQPSGSAACPRPSRPLCMRSVRALASRTCLLWLSPAPKGRERSLGPPAFLDRCHLLGTPTGLMADESGRTRECHSWLRLSYHSLLQVLNAQAPSRDSDSVPCSGRVHQQRAARALHSCLARRARPQPPARRARITGTLPSDLIPMSSYSAKWRLALQSAGLSSCSQHCGA